jgi:hypothetical protein
MSRTVATRIKCVFNRVLMRCIDYCTLSNWIWWKASSIKVFKALIRCYKQENTYSTFPRLSHYCSSYKQCKIIYYFLYKAQLRFSERGRERGRNVLVFGGAPHNGAAPSRGTCALRDDTQNLPNKCSRGEIP